MNSTIPSGHIATALSVRQHEAELNAEWKRNLTKKQRYELWATRFLLLSIITSVVTAFAVRPWLGMFSVSLWASFFCIMCICRAANDTWEDEE